MIKNKLVSDGGLLPNGKFTKDVKRYCREWKKLYSYLEKELPGLKIIGFDPSFLFSWNPNETNGIPIEMPTSFVLALVERLKKKPIGIEEFSGSKKGSFSEFLKKNSRTLP